MNLLQGRDWDNADRIRAKQKKVNSNLYQVSIKIIDYYHRLHVRLVAVSYATLRISLTSGATPSVLTGKRCPESHTSSVLEFGSHTMLIVRLPVLLQASVLESVHVNVWYRQHVARIVIS